MGKLLIGYRAWREQDYLLDKMTLADLVRAYSSYPAIQFNLVVAALFMCVALALFESAPLLLLVVAVAVVVYTLVEYIFHRFVLHGRLLYKAKTTAAFWKRVHYDHHQDPNDLAVLFGDLRTTLPPIFVIAIPIGYVIHGTAGAAAAVSSGVLLVSLYEFCHCAQHLSYEPSNRFLKRLKKRHILHHFHNETGNFGITSHFWDLVFGTNFDAGRERPRSATVRNLGYTGKEIERYPWVRELSADDVGSTL